MLIKSDLQYKFYAKAINIANYTLNRWLLQLILKKTTHELFISPTSEALGENALHTIMEKKPW